MASDHRLTLGRAEIAEAAAKLDAAETSRQPITQLSLLHPRMNIHDAYAIQGAWVDLKVSAGRQVKGYKIGLTSRAMQVMVNVDTPDSGVLLDDMFYEDGATIGVDRFIAPRLEAELAFVLKHDLSGPDCSVTDVINATDFVLPALELLDARVQRVDPTTGKTRTVLDTISDNAANAALVLGSVVARPQDIDMRWLAAICYRNGSIEETGVAAGVLGHPALGVAWLANRLAGYGVTLKAGQVFLSGSFVRSIEVKRGDVFHVEYDKLGSIACSFG
jgi:2-oxo-hept-3-ene-1,7-dioate hydratase